MTATDTTPTAYSTREAWLTAAIEAVAPWYVAVGQPLPPVRVSVGWPGGRGNKSSTIGQCWSGKAASDGIAQIFISPVLGNASRVLDVLVHELVHAINFGADKYGHGRDFKVIAEGLGLTGKMTATVASPELKVKLDELAEELGAYPHSRLGTGMITEKKPEAPGDPDGKPLTPWGTPKQAARMIKCTCDECGWTFRAARSWIEKGLPSCVCGDGIFTVQD